MPGFENKPYSKDDYDKNAEDAESLKKQMVGAKTADEMMAIATKMKSVEENENTLMGNAQEEAGKEDEERKAYDEAVAEDAERNMYDEAKTEDAERTTAKETEKMDADLENLKSQIVGAKNADEMMKIAEKIKEIEEKKKGIEAGSQKEEAGKRGKELEELKLKDETESAEKVKEILKKLNGGEKMENQETLSPDVQKYIDKMPVKDGMYMGNYLEFDVPKELMGDENFLLKVAEVNPASAYSHASEELKHNKEFIIKLMKSQPRAETDKVNYHSVNFYEIERETPELLYDKDVAMTLIERSDDHRGRLGSMRAELLKDKDIYEAVTREAISDLVKEAEKFAKKKSGGYAPIPDFKLRDGSTLGGERWSMKNDQEFMKKVTEAVSGIVDVSMKDGYMYFEPKA